MDIIEEEFKSRGMLVGLTYLYNSDDSIEVIGRCRQLDLKILGIDVFEISTKGHQVIDYIDYSSGGIKPKNDQDVGFWEEAEQYVKDRMNSGYWFEIVYSDPS